MTASEARITVAAVGMPERIGRFRVVRRLARGHAADILLCEDDGTRVVLRIDRHPFRGSLEAIRREALPHSRLRHSAIACLHGVFPVDGHLVVATEYVEGVSLNVLRLALAKNDLSLPLGAALHLAARVFAGIAAAHAISPEPVVLGHLRPSLAIATWDGEVKLQTYEPDGEQPDVRRTGPEWTVQRYRAPEQLHGAPASPAADVYVGALMACELLARGGSSDSVDSLDGALDTAVREALDLALKPDVATRVVTAPMLAAVLRSAADALHGRAALVELLEQVRKLAGDAEPPSQRQPPPRAAGSYRFVAPDRDD